MYEGGLRELMGLGGYSRVGTFPPVFLKSIASSCPNVSRVATVNVLLHI